VIARSYEGLVAAQMLFLVAGLGVLWAFRGWRTWLDLLRSLGLAYLLGVGGIGVLATLVLIAGYGVGTPVVVALSLGLALAGSVCGYLGRRPLPRVGGFTRPRTDPTALFADAIVVLVVVVLVEFLRASLRQGIVAWDSWTFWVPKAKAIYFFGGLDPQLFRSLANPSYPLLVPALQAMDFHLAGSADVGILAAQYWLLFAAFVFAVPELLREVVPPQVLWPFLLLACVVPELDRRFTNAQGDWPLDIFFTLSAISLARWLLTRESWLLCTYGAFLAAALATKREGQLMAVCLVLAALLATWRRARTIWPWVVGVAAAAYVLNIPWRIWWSSRGLSSGGPEIGFRALFSHLDRLGPSIRIVLHLLFQYDFWLVAVPIALVAAIAVALRREFVLPSFFLMTVVLLLVGFVWILWAYVSLPLDTSSATPIPREVASVVLLSLVFAPLLLSRLLVDAELDADPQQPATAAPAAA
jgi:hypothetical protein